MSDTEMAAVASASSARSGSVEIPLLGSDSEVIEIPFDGLPALGTLTVTLLSVTECSADVDGNGTLNVDDIDAFVGLFLAGDLDADLDGSGTLNIDDVDAFVASFLAGCG